jgi:peptide/nickel transport system ATP-binding protein
MPSEPKPCPHPGLCALPRERGKVAPILQREREPAVGGGDDLILDVRELRVEFPTRRGTLTAVDGVSFQVRRGETLGLVGESGCGKTVTGLSILGLVDRPGRIAAGEIRFRGEDLLAKSEREMRRLRGDALSMIFQDPTVTLNPVLRISEQMTEVLRYHRGLGRGEARERCMELLRLVGIPRPEERLDHYPHEFSGGMQQRVIIAIALALEPELLLADEPTTALDVTVQAQIIDLLKRLKRERAGSMVLITHDLGVVAQLCDRVAVMYAGNIVEVAPLRQLLEEPRHPYTRGLLGCVPRLEMAAGGRLRSIPGVVPDLVEPPRGCKFQPRCERALDICGPRRPKLVEVAPQHFVACYLYPEVVAADEPPVGRAVATR